jgi:hypothetical protein
VVFFDVDYLVVFVFGQTVPIDVFWGAQVEISVVVVQVEEVGIMDDDLLRDFFGGLTPLVCITHTREFCLLERDLTTLIRAEIQFYNLISIF